MSSTSCEWLTTSSTFLRLTKSPSRCVRAFCTSTAIRRRTSLSSRAIPRKRCRCLARAMPSKLFVKHSSMRLSPGRRLSSMKRARWQKQIEALIGPVFESDARYGGSLMERFNDGGSEENILNFNVADDALERAAALADG